MKHEITVLMMMGFLASCATPDFDPTAMPDVVVYTPVQQMAVHDELMECPAPMTIEFLKDYHVMRNQARIGRGEVVKFE